MPRSLAEGTEFEHTCSKCLKTALPQWFALCRNIQRCATFAAKKVLRISSAVLKAIPRTGYQANAYVAPRLPPAQVLDSRWHWQSRQDRPVLLGPRKSDASVSDARGKIYLVTI